MKRVSTGLVGLGLAASLGIAFALPGVAKPAPDVSGQDRTVKSGDALPNPLETKRQALRNTAITSVIDGDAKPVTKNGSTVVKVGEGHSPADAAALANKKATSKQRQSAQGSKTKDQYVELKQERADKVFVILAEFGDKRHPDFPDKDSDPAIPGPTTFDGPLHNKIPEPDRTKDNSTVWQSDYNQQHYQDLYFAKGNGAESLKTYYETQSSGRYTVDGAVSDWVKVPYNEARYGRDDSSKTVWNLIQDALEAWVADQKAAGKSDAEIKQAIASYDKYDRYDYDGDGDFNEPDGYIDHFQIVHAGGDEADGDPQQGEDAIWSHRWYAFYTDQGLTGPSFNKLGGTQIADTGIWVGDYTTQPENGGLSVFTHEYGHDLGLPDDYDTSGGGDNNSEYWTLMAQSRLNDKGEPLGTRPGDLGAWNKLQLGWFDYEVAKPGTAKTDRPRPAGVQHLQGPGCGGRAAQEERLRRQRRSGDRDEAVLVRQRRRPQQHDDDGPRPHRQVRRHVDGQGPLLDRGGLRLRLPAGLDRRWLHLDGSGRDARRPAAREGRVRHADVLR